MRKEKVIIDYSTGETEEFRVLDRELISKYHTKQLLNARWHGISQMDRDEYIRMYLSYNNWAVRVGDLVDELATREHIPNKAEARKIRQEKAKRCTSKK